MRLAVLSSLLLVAACSPIEPTTEEPEEREWPSILQSKPTDAVAALAAEAEAEPLAPVERPATDRWLTGDAALRAEIEPLAKRLEADGSLAGWGTGGGTAHFDLAVTEEEWDELLKRNEWEIPAYVDLAFVRPLIAPAIGRGAEEWVRVMPNEPRRTVFQLEALGSGRIFLEDGCLYVGNPEGIRNLAFFHAETGVDLRDGGLVLVDRLTGRTRGRVGEDFSWGAPNEFDEEWVAAKQLREACGEGTVVNVGNPESSAVFEARGAG